MKKLLALLLVCVLCTCLLAACGKECDVCGETGSVDEYEYGGETMNLCDDCQEDFEDIETAVDELEDLLD